MPSRTTVSRACALLGPLAIAVVCVAATPASRQLVGSWTIDAGVGNAIYQFEPDGKFTLTFEGPAGGQAGGAWQLQGDRLTMDNTWSNVPYTRAGEKETAQVVDVTADRLQLRTADIKGRPELLTLAKMTPPPPFQKGKADDPRLAGAYRMLRERSYLLVLSSDGRAVFHYGGGPYIGEWAQKGNTLILRSRELGEFLAGETRGSPTTAPAGHATTQPAHPRPPLPQLGASPTLTTRPSVTVYKQPVTPATRALAPRPTTNQVVFVRTDPLNIAEVIIPIRSFDGGNLRLLQSIRGVEYPVDYYRVDLP